MIGSRANPYYLIVDPKTGKSLRKTFGFMSEAKFLEFLRGSDPANDSLRGGGQH
jgi:hypothetical protein